MTIFVVCNDDAMKKKFNEAFGERGASNNKTSGTYTHTFTFLIRFRRCVFLFVVKSKRRDTSGNDTNERLKEYFNLFKIICFKFVFLFILHQYIKFIRVIYISIFT